MIRDEGCEHNCEPTPENTRPDAKHYLDCPVWAVIGWPQL